MFLSLLVHGLAGNQKVPKGIIFATTAPQAPAVQVQSTFVTWTSTNVVTSTIELGYTTVMPIPASFVVSEKALQAHQADGAPQVTKTVHMPGDASLPLRNVGLLLAAILVVPFI